MASTRAGARNSSLAELSSHAEAISPTAIQTASIIAQESPLTADHVTNILHKTIVETTPQHAVFRQTSLIPAYRYEDTIDDLELNNLLGTPYTCEVVQAKKKEKKNLKKAIKAAKINEEIKVENPPLALSPPAASPPPPSVAANDLEDNSALSAQEIDESNDLIAIMEAMSLDRPSTTSPTTNTTTPSNAKENSDLEETKKGHILKGVPAPTGSHIRFDDEDSTSTRVYLRGLPQPTGTHTTFEEN